jgi:glycosyltransferase involved in cell wall biosynthesis
MGKVKVLAIYNSSGPCYHRVFLPLSAMPEIDVTFTNVVGPNSHVKKFEGFDTVFVNRMFPMNKLSEVLNARKKYGFRLIVDMDDHWELDATHYLSKHYERFNLSTYILHAITCADAVSVTHERLAEAVAPYCKNVFILPNSIDGKHPQFNIENQPGAKTRLFWAGGITHGKDLEILRNPIRRIYSDSYLKERVMMVMGGYSKGEKEWDKMASIYTNGLKMPGCILYGKPVHEYYSLYQFADVCLIPLIPNRFNSYKSNLKILEAANLGLPVIVSNVHPYKGFPPELVNYVNTQQDWYRHVRRLIRDPTFAAQQGQALKEYVNEVYNFDKINEARCRMLTGSE